MKRRMVTRKKPPIIVAFLFASVMLVIAIGIISLLNFLRPGGLSSSVNTDSPVALGKIVYQTRCSSCHGDNLQGHPNWQPQTTNHILAPSLQKGTRISTATNEEIKKVILQGGNLVDKPVDTGMPSFNTSLNEAEIEAVIEYLQSSWAP